MAAPAKVDALIPYTDLRGENMAVPEWAVYQDEWQRFNMSGRSEAAQDVPIDFVVTPVRSRQDYLLYAYREFLRNGFDGIYWDNICLYDNENPATGNGYLRDDGQFQPDTDIWELRELTRRRPVLALPPAGQTQPDHAAYDQCLPDPGLQLEHHQLRLGMEIRRLRLPGSLHAGSTSARPASGGKAGMCRWHYPASPK